jgi:hypothetical protein
MSEAWVTDDDLHSAQQRFAAQIPGLIMPVAYGVARKDASELTFGHVNVLGAVRPLPAVVLASVCGYVATTGVYRLDRERFAEAVDLLAPAEAATHMPHPNLCSWRDLLAQAGADSSFLAFFVAAATDPPVDRDDAQFRQLLTAALGLPPRTRRQTGRTEYDQWWRPCQSGFSGSSHGDAERSLIFRTAHHQQ